jgi:hypothetical protein
MLALVGPASAAPAQPVVIPNAGPMYGALSVTWQKYTNEQPAATNPLLDTTGQNCAAGQNGPVFFLVGDPSGKAETRECSLPAGKLIFFPIVNCNWIHIPLSVAPPPIGDDKTSVAQVWDALQSPTEGCGPRSAATNLHANVDGTAIKDLNASSTPYYVCAGPSSAGCTAPAFSVTLPNNNLYQALGVPVPAGTYYPAVADGFYILLAPLSPGTHTISFGGSWGVANPFTQDNKYTLTVERT